MKIGLGLARDAGEAWHLIAGERDPEVLAKLARGRMKAKHPQLVEALTGRLDAHHAELARVLLDQVDALTAKVDMLTARVAEIVAKLPSARVPSEGQPAAAQPGGSASPGPLRQCQEPLPVLERLDEVPGIDRVAAQAIIAEIGLDMGQFPTAGHLVSWARISPRRVQSGPRTTSRKPGMANLYLRGVLGE